MPDRPAPPLCPLEARLEELLQIELTKDLEAIPMAAIVTEGTQDGYTLGLEAEVANLRKALRNLCLAVEELVEQDADEWTAALYDAYEEGRKAIGAPLVAFPGGEEGEHFHFLEFDPERDECSWCDEAESKKQEDARATPRD